MRYKPFSWLDVRTVGAAGLLCLGVMTAERLLLLVKNESLVPHTIGTWVSCFWVGLQFDLTVIGVLGLPAMLLALRRTSPFDRRRGLLSASLFTAWFLILYLILCDIFFFEEFNAHFNYVAVDYIFVNGHEVLQNIWQSYPVIPATLWIVLVAAALTRLTLIFGGSPSKATPHPHRWAALWFALTLVGLGLTDIRKIHAAGNRVLGELSTNSLYTLAYALWTHDLQYDHYYETIPEDEATQRVRRLVGQPGQTFLSHGSAVFRRVPSAASPKRLNVVIILVESFGSEFVDALYPHTPPLTPEFSRLSREGLFFSNIYATGNRTVRGLEGVLASYPPIPGGAIVKRKPARDVPTLASLFKSNGYRTFFIYGGRGLFDNMRAFMKRNGFDAFLEQKDYPHPPFTSAWGVPDEDIFNKAHDTFDEAHRLGKPFFATVLTVSNHRPYTYPKGRINRNPDDHRRENAVAYTDWAIGQFFKKARSKPYFKDTLFVILGDHGARVYGSDFIPIASYEIPLLFYSPFHVPAQRLSTLGGSIDVAPTILGILGWGYDSPFYGRDLRKVPADEGWALMQHDRDIARYDKGRLVVLSMPKSAVLFRFDPRKKTFTYDPDIPAAGQSAIRDAVAYYQIASHDFERLRNPPAH